jgi:hypothetical protein
LGVCELIAWTFPVMFSIVRFLRPAGEFEGCFGADMVKLQRFYRGTFVFSLRVGVERGLVHVYVDGDWVYL